MKTFVRRYCRCLYSKLQFHLFQKWLDKFVDIKNKQELLTTKTTLFAQEDPELENREIQWQSLMPAGTVLPSLPQASLGNVSYFYQGRAQTQRPPVPCNDTEPFLPFVEITGVSSPEDRGQTHFSKVPFSIRVSLLPYNRRGVGLAGLWVSPGMTVFTLWRSLFPLPWP